MNNLTRETITFLLLTLISGAIFFGFVNLKPQVDNNFFFSSDDPQFQSEKRISELFVRNDTQMIISATGDIKSPLYFKKIEDLSTALQKVDGITGVKSLSNGPSNLEDALASPLWSRLLIADDLNSTSLIILIEEKLSSQVINPIEDIMNKFSSTDFELKASGLPYVVDLIRRNLVRDITVFSSLALIIFSLVILWIYRSRGILLGMLITCINACMITFMITNLLNIPVGLLTANLVTIIFVLTLSHLIFFTYNWKTAYQDFQNSNEAIKDAYQTTLPASFWSMLTTLLGFISLLFVPAKPLRDLGIAGSVGTLVAFCVTYSIYPAFLKIVRDKTAKKEESLSQSKNIYNFIESKKKSIILLISIICVMGIPGLWMMNTDPSMLSYFSKSSEIYSGLKYIDKNGGSSPLIVVIRSKNSETLNSRQSYERLWNLQEVLEQHRSVGSIISLPVLMAQAKESPLTFFLSWEWLLDILEKPQYDSIAKSFVTEDRKYGLFLLRMNELNRLQPRLEIVEELKNIIESRGFFPEIVGGVYSLQGHMAKLVASSLIFGLARLILLFSIIAWIISRSIRITLAMTLSICFIPVAILGVMGLYRIPLDIISAPASNIAIAMGIDSMIHMVNAYRRKKKKGQGSWKDIRSHLWQPVLTATLVIMAGFGIFLFSTFPPTQRFGIAIVFGTLIAAITALYIMPSLYELQIKIFSKYKNSN